jgi:hypothetical protein
MIAPLRDGGTLHNKCIIMKRSRSVFKICTAVTNFNYSRLSHRRKMCIVMGEMRRSFHVDGWEGVGPGVLDDFLRMNSNMCWNRPTGSHRTHDYKPGHWVAVGYDWREPMDQVSVKMNWKQLVGEGNVRSAIHCYIIS